MTAKRKDCSMNELNQQAKRVRIESVLQVPSAGSSTQRVSHPSLISFARSLSPEEVERTRVKLVHREGEPKQDGSFEMIAENGGRAWTGKKGFNEMNHDYFIGIRNKMNNTLSLVAVDGMYSLRPYIGRRLTENPEIPPEDIEEQTYAEKRAELLEKFGGRKSQRREQKYLRNRITDENVDDKTEEKIKEAAKQMLEKDTSQGIVHVFQQTTESLAPPHDSSATTPELAYPLEGLVTPGELRALEQEARAMMQTCSDGTGNIDNPGWHPLVWTILLRIIRNADLTEDARLPRIQAAMHLHYLIVLTGTTDKILRATRLELMQSMAVDEGILSCILDRFTVSDDRQYVRKKTQEDVVRAILYGIVMWLTACGFRKCGNVGQLSAALGISSTLLIKHAMQIGCKVHRKPDQRDASDFLVSLKVPLTFPKIRKRQGRPAKRG